MSILPYNLYPTTNSSPNFVSVVHIPFLIALRGVCMVSCTFQSNLKCLRLVLVACSQTTSISLMRWSPSLSLVNKWTALVVPAFDLMDAAAGSFMISLVWCLSLSLSLWERDIVPDPCPLELRLAISLSSYSSLSH
jgi:hypothetical protein